MRERLQTRNAGAVREGKRKRPACAGPLARPETVRADQPLITVCSTVLFSKYTTKPGYSQRVIGG